MLIFKINSGKCRLGTANCDGKAYITECNDTRRRNTQQIVRCNKCKRKRTVKNSIQDDGEIGGKNQIRATFFSQPDKFGTSHTKLQIRIALLIMYCWAKDLSLKLTKDLMGNLIANRNETLVDWRNYMREVCLKALRDPDLLKMGGIGQVVQIDESLIRGKRKYNRGRLLLGNGIPPARRNYGNTVVGPWVFGMVWVRPDGKKDLRMFHVLRRNETTLRPIIQQNIAPGSIIVSDEWLAYKNISNWNNFNYIHRTVNHSQNFVNPIDGANTQRIETYWGKIKTKLIRLMRGTNENLLPGHLAEFWWKEIHKDTPFNDIIIEIRRQFPLD